MFFSFLSKRNTVMSVLLCYICALFLYGCGDYIITDSNDSNVSYDFVQSTSEAYNKNVDNINENHVIESDDNKSDIDISDARFINEGKLTVAMVVDYPPFEYYPTGGNVPIGVDVDIVSSISKKLGLELEIIDVPWDDDLFNNMGIDYDIVCSAITITDERLENMLFSDSYMINFQSVVINKNRNLDIKSFNDLNGLKVAVQKDTVSDQLVKDLNDNEEYEISLIENDVATDCFDQLTNNEIDAIVCDSTEAEGQIARNKDVFFEVYRDKSNPEKFAIAISKDNLNLQKAINEALKEMDDEGAINKIISNWFNR